MSTSEAFREPDRPLPDRVADLLGQLTLAEKVALLHQYQAAVPRLGVGPFRTGTEALHGLAWLGPATVFPQAVGLASTWDPVLVRRVGAAVGDEVRGFHHKDPSGAGLNVWAPVVNPLRDPRWGRNEEGYSEDPWLTGVMGTAYAGGLRGDHPSYLKTAPTLKHFLGYNNETLRDRSSSNLPPRVLHEYELPAFRAPIEAGAAVAAMASYNLVNGRPAHVHPLINEQLRRWSPDDVLVVSDAQAPSNLVNLQHYYRDHATSHAAAVRAGVDSFTDNDADPSLTVARLTEALQRGLLTESDVDIAVRHILAVRMRLGEFDPIDRNPYAGITADVVNSPPHQALARAAARRAVVLLKHECQVLPLPGDRPLRVAVLGPLADSLHEDWYSGTLPYRVTARDGIAARIGEAATAYHEGVDRVALRVTGDSPSLRVVDSPDGGPLRAAAASVAEAARFDLFDWGRGVHALRATANGRYVTVDEEGLLVNEAPGPHGWVVRETFRLVESGEGVRMLHVASGRYVAVGGEDTLRLSTADPKDATIFVVEVLASGGAEAAALARDADVAVVVLGNHPLVNGRECEDRADLALPRAQEALLRAVHEANSSTVLVLMSSYPYAVGWAERHLPAVLWTSHGGQELGHALADVLFGADDAGAPVDPTGRLTQTWYRSAAELPDLFDYDIIANDATYLYYRGTPLYPFGHGLSYTTFEYENLHLSADTVDATGEVTVSLDVVNTGPRPGEDIVQLYTHQQRSRVKQPLRQLRGFRRISLAPGERATVSLPLRAADLWFWDVTRGRPVVEAARHKVLVGRSAADIVLAATLTVRGERIPPRDPCGPLWAMDHDDYAGIALRDETPQAGDVVVAAEAGAWVSFADVDFGAGVATCRARVAKPTGDPARVLLRLDDPLGGPVVATIGVPCTGDRHAWTDVSVPVSGAAGVHDLYLVFEAEETLVSQVSFTPEGSP